MKETYNCEKLKEKKISIDRKMNISYYAVLCKRYKYFWKYFKKQIKG